MVKTTKKIKIFYHKSDMDGLASAAIIKYYYLYSEPEPVNLCFCGYEYGDPKENLLDDIKEYDLVYVVDICFHPFSDMITLAKKANVVWIDHHHGAILEYKKDKKKLPKSFKCHLGDSKNSKSACELVWNYFYKRRIVPKGIRNISLMDTWQHDEDYDIISFYFGAEANLPDIYTVQWNKFLEDDAVFYNKVQSDGRLVWNYTQRQRLKNADETAFEVMFDGFRAIVINSADKGSHQFERVHDPAKHDVMLVFNRKKDHWKFSIYTKSKNIDCSVVAKKYGGGGHLQASGFEIYGETLPFAMEKIDADKTA